MSLFRVMAAIAVSLAVGAPALPASPPVPSQQVTPGQCLDAALSDLNRIEWVARNAELVIGGTTMDRLLGGELSYSAEQIAEAERTQRESPARIAAARAEVARWRATGARPSPDPSDYVPARLDALLQRCLATQATPAPTAPVQTPVATAASMLTFSRLDGQDPSGFDLGSVEVAPRDYEACRAICAADSRCMAFNVYTPPPGDKGFCWVKHTAGPTRPDPASIGGVRGAGPAVVTPAMSVVFNRSDGRDAAGNDLGMVEVPARDFARCSALCAANDRCRAFNLYTPAPHDKSFCWLKHTAGPMRDDPNSVTGVRTASGDRSGPPMTSQPQGRGATPNGPPTAWETPYMNPQEPLYALHTDPPGTAFYSSLPRPAGPGRHEMWVVAVLRGVADDPAGAYDLGASLYGIDCNARSFQVLRGQVYRDMVPVRDTPTETPVRPEPASLAGRFIAFACDNPPLPPFAGSLAQVRQAVPLASRAPAPVARAASAPPPPAPTPRAPSGPGRCVSSGECYYAVVMHVGDETNAYQASYDGTRLGWGIQVSDTPSAGFSVPFTICGIQVYAPAARAQDIRGRLNPTSEAAAGRFSLSPHGGGFPICAWSPPRWTGPNR